MIAIDVMGGDFAPLVVLQGAWKATSQKNIPILLCGPKAIIHDWLAQNAPDWQKYPITIIETQSIIDMAEEPVSAVRKKTDSSLVKAVDAVKQGQAQAVISAGNSGALMVAATLILGRQTGIERPAIASALPTLTSKNILVLDLGANTECRPHYLEQFAHLGSHYYSKIYGTTSPRIALLSNGHEAGKGSLLVKETHKILAANTTINFVGNVEPYDMFTDKTDVIVCDGFSGNILLKTAEAVAQAFIVSLVKKGQNPTQYCPLDYKQLGGAPLLGVNGNVIVCHGNCDADDIERAILFTWQTSKKNS